MAAQDIIISVQRYLNALIAKGLEPSFGVLFGSHTRGDINEWSDIDLVVIAPRYDGDYEHKDVALLWGIAALTDPRIEPIPCGVKQWEEDDGTPILEVARREGVRIDLKEW